MCISVHVTLFQLYQVRSKLHGRACSHQIWRRLSRYNNVSYATTSGEAASRMGARRPQQEPLTENHAKGVGIPNAFTP